MTDLTANPPERTASADGAPADDTPGWAARKLLRAARSATLATSLAGQPFASLVTPATAPDLALLLLLSSLSEHTRHLRAEPRCSLLVVGAPAAINPQLCVARAAPSQMSSGRFRISQIGRLACRVLSIAVRDSTFHDGRPSRSVLSLPKSFKSSA